MAEESNKHKHLEFIQNVISRMASNSFLIKGWTISLVAVILTLGKDSTSKSSIVLTIFITAIFWILDGFYVSLERCYRELYSTIAKTQNSEIDYLMDFRPFKLKEKTWFRSTFSLTLVLYYLSIIISILIIS